MDYENFTCKELLSDDFFLASISDPTVESELFWQEKAAQNSRLAKEIALAKEIIVSASHCRSHLSSDGAEALFERISASIADQRNAGRKAFFRTTVVSVAACLLLLVTGGFFVFGYLSKKNRPAPAVDAPVDLTPVLASEIQLFKPDGNIMLEGDAPEIWYDKQGELSLNTGNFPERMVPPLPTVKIQSPRHQLLVPYAKRSFLTLSDGSKIWVNANTRLTYPAVFDNEQREIYVEGEIYLEVAPDEERPFTVRTKEMDISVLGTSFNVSAYGNNNATTVVLVSGKVNVSTGNNRDTVMLSPGEFALLKRDRLETGRAEIENHVSWRLGRYVFNRESFSAVLNRLSNFYGKELIMDQESEDFHCSGTLNLKDDLEGLLQSLAKAYPITFRIEDNLIIVNVQSKK